VTRWQGGLIELAHPANIAGFKIKRIKKIIINETAKPRLHRTMKKHQLYAGLISSTMALGISTGLAQHNAAQIEADASGTVVTTTPLIITAILNQAGTFNGKFYVASGTTYLAADSTGSLEIYGTQPSGFTPVVGDSINVAGTFSPFHAIPEISTLTSITLNSTGNSSPLLPVTTTISAINGASVPESLAGQLITLDNVTISDSASGDSTLPSSGEFGTGNLTLTATDASGTETLYYYPGDYSVANVNIYGDTILGTYDITGIASESTTSGGIPEFIPISLIAVPEPASLALCGVASILGLADYRQRLKGGSGGNPMK
jgi:hypothetical protein